jgi:hypothetical protein
MNLEFWLLEPADGSRRVDSFQDRGTIRCSYDPGHARAGQPSGLVSANLSKLAAGLDFVWTWSSEILVSDRAEAELRRAKITGFRTEPLASMKATGRILEGFKRLAVTGWGGIAGSTRGVEVGEQCDVCGHVSYFAHSADVIDPSAWNGEDVFFVWPFPKFVFVSQRFRDVVRSADLSGCVFAPARIDPDTTYTPGRLEYYLPSDRIAALPRL